MRFKFQSTHPARGATGGRILRPPSGVISIHAPREGCDQTFMSLPLETREFQSTHPARGATIRHRHVGYLAQISIHAPREGCDGGTNLTATIGGDFNPRTPRGVRPAPIPSAMVNWLFQSTHPARGATGLEALRNRWPGDFNPRTPRGVRRGRCRGGKGLCNFNPRTPRGVRRGNAGSGTPPAMYFNPRTPRGVRPSPWRRWPIAVKFQSTHPARGATVFRSLFLKSPAYFNPRTPRGVRLGRAPQGRIHILISIHAPREGCDGNPSAVP